MNGDARPAGGAGSGGKDENRDAAFLFLSARSLESK